MAKYTITIRNYRNIPYNNPLTIEIREGISFILGVNNIGKSNILKFFYEFGNIMNNDSKFIPQTGNPSVNLRENVLFSSIKKSKITKKISKSM